MKIWMIANKIFGIFKKYSWLFITVVFALIGIVFFRKRINNKFFSGGDELLKRRNENEKIINNSNYNNYNSDGTIK